MMHRQIPSLVTMVLIFAVGALQAQDQPRRGGPPPREGRGQPPGFQPPPFPLMEALDADKDQKLSKQEMENAIGVLRSLDKNKDGALSQQETGWPPFGRGAGRGRVRGPERVGNPGRERGRDPGPDRRREPGRERGRGGIPRGGRGGFPFPPPPVITALDADNNGEISAKEIQNAPAALQTLDQDNNGELADAELMPDFGGRGGFPGGGRGRFRFGGGDSNVELLQPEQVKFEDGVANIPDHATFHKLSYKGEEVMIDTFLADLEFVKFTITEATSDKPKMYFINTKNHRAHMMFGRTVGLGFRDPGQMKGVLVYRPMLKAPNGKPGLYTFEFEPFDTFSFKMVKIARDLLVTKMPVLDGKLGYYPRERGIDAYETEKATYDASDLPVYREQDLHNTDIAFLPLNQGEAFGRLRLMNLDERPGPRDVVLYNTLPNEMSRVAGVITAVRQTPLSHVNLRAIQDKIPNAFIADAAKHETIKPLIGKDVRYQVTPDGFDLREAKREEVEAHFANLRPAKRQVPRRDLTVQKVRPLSEIKFEDSFSFGVKTANLATLRTFGFPEGTVPDGFGVPFFFYDEFMKHNGFYDYVSQLLKTPEFQRDRDTQEAKLKKLRALIKKGKMPDWMMTALSDLQKSFPKGASMRCRSSTNNEDLPGFSGAGLYDSYTHHPREGHLSKSIKQVFASLWNYRAFEEREFNRVDHLAAAMGVLIHPNFKGELANGVAVTSDILYQSYGNYYLNIQVGEDLVTNPEQQSIPEEVLLGWWDRDPHRIVRRSNRVPSGKQILSDEHLRQMRSYLTKIHSQFSRLYGHTLEDDDFAMEIEFKITRQGRLAIKQARPWVF